MRATFSTLVAIAAWGVTAAAQIAPPSQPTTAVFGRRARVDANVVSTQVSATVDVAGGYDDNTDSLDEISAAPGLFNSLQSGNVLFASASLNVRSGRDRRFVAGDVRGYTSRSSAGVEELTGGVASLQATTNVGRRYGLVGDAGINLQPAGLFNAYGPVSQQFDIGGVPGSTPSQGLTSQRFVAVDSGAGVYAQWTTHNRTDVRYSRSSLRPLSGPGLESGNSSTLFSHSWQPRRFASLRLSYRLGDNEQQLGAQAAQSLRVQDFRGGVSLQRRLSRARAVSVSIDAGVIRSRTDAAVGNAQTAFSSPSGSFSARLDLSRGWSLAADVGRSVGVLDGLSTDPFATTATSVQLYGTIGRRVQLAVVGAHSNGGALQSQRGSFESTGASTQLQYALSRSWATFASYSYYDHRLLDVNVVPTGFATRYGRNAFRVGASVWLPIFGIPRA